MQRHTLVNGALLALALGSAAAVWVTRETPTTGELEARKHKLLPSFDKAGVDELSLSRAGRTLRLARAESGPDSGEFRILEPWLERADIASVNQLLGSLELASALRPADAVTTEQAGLGQGALRIEVKTAERRDSIVLGNPAPSPSGARYAEVTSDGVTRRYVVSSGVAGELDVAFDKFRETRLLEYGRREIAKLRFEQGSQTLTLEQHEHSAFFFAAAHGSELASRDVVERVLTALSRLASEHFVEVEQAKRGLGDNPLQLELRVFEPKVPPVELSFGATCPDAPELSLVLRQQAGRQARAACISRDVFDALHVAPGELELAGPFAARTDEVEELRISEGARKLDLARKDDAFVLRAPGSSEVALDAGNQRISAILSARGQRPEAAPAALGLEPPAGEMVAQIAGGDEAAHREERVKLGRARADGGVCVERALDGVVLCFDAETAKSFAPDATLLRALEVLHFAPSELSSLEVDEPGLHERVLRSPDGSYQLVEPSGFHHDGELTANAVQTLGALRAARFAAAGAEPAHGLAQPRLRVRFALAAGGAARELVVGAPTSDGFFAQLSPDPAVFVLPRSAFTDLATPLVDRSLSPLKSADLERVELRAGEHQLVLERDGDAWRGGDVPAARAADLVEALGALRAERAVHLGKPSPVEGFAHPSLRIELEGKDGQHHSILLGARDLLDDAPVVYARLDDVDATFALSARTAEALQDL